MIDEPVNATGLSKLLSEIRNSSSSLTKSSRFTPFRNFVNNKYDTMFVDVRARILQKSIRHKSNKIDKYHKNCRKISFSNRDLTESNMRVDFGYKATTMSIVFHDIRVISLTFLFCSNSPYHVLPTDPRDKQNAFE